MKKLVFGFLFLSCRLLFAQDCSQATWLTQAQHTAQAPKDGGTQELGENKLGNLYYFEKEHHTVWYQFRTTQDCELTFEIIPDDIKDDYDFLLFRCASPNDCCEQIRNKTLLPIRSNISRNNKKINSQTGLKKDKALPQFVHSGVGSAYSQSVSAKKDEHFILVLDNVYTQGSGHRININACLDKIEQIQETPKIVEKPVEEQPKQEVFRPEIADTLKTVPQISTEKSPEFTLLEDAYEKNTTIVLDKLYFHGNSSFLTPDAAPQVAALYEFMSKYPQSKIILHAHTNGSSREIFSAPKNPKKSVFASNEIMAFSPEHARTFKGSSEKLAEERGKSIKEFLKNKGIDEKRVDIKAWGDKKMLYDQYSVDAHKNRRIEVEILK